MKDTMLQAIGYIASILASVFAIYFNFTTAKARKYIDSVVNDDKKYKEFLDFSIAEFMKLKKSKQSYGDIVSLYTVETTPDNALYIARALREGQWTHYRANQYYVVRSGVK
jgi:hypothetical protein